ncbi:MAG TPA: glycosyltransferase family 39 protein [bacterium]|nr:glycosyltransferase family 39 protein [bacterium]HPN44926.1 glycosyltransferase family 39 protein [bacterium]
MKKLLTGFLNCSERKFLIIVFVLVLAVRLGYILTLEDRWYFYDTVHYDKAAQHIVAGEGFGPSVYFSNLYKNYCLEPLYPLFLAGVYFVAGHSLLAARIAEVLVSLLALLVLYQMSKSLVTPTAARLTLVYAGFYPFFVYLPGLLYITQLFSFFILLSVLGFLRFFKNPHWGWMVFAGVFLGLGVLAQPIYMFAIPLFGLWILLMTNAGIWKRIGMCLVLGVTLLLVFTPWTVRNYLVFHKAKFARACLPQGQIYGETFWNIARNRALEQDSVAVTKFSVYYHVEQKQSIFDCYLDDNYFFTLHPYENITLPDSNSYFGIVFAGPDSNYVHQVVARQRVSMQGEFVNLKTWNSLDTLEIVSGADSVQYNGAAIRSGGATKYWNYSLVFKMPVNANYFEIHYPQPVSPLQLRRAALLVFLDQPTLDANGYMIWLHPWGEPDLWWYRDGKPFDSVPVKKTFTDENKVNLLYLLSHYPYEFIFKHFIPEFINFWNPKITRVISEETQPGRIMQLVSILSFTPVLLLFPVGIWALRKKMKMLLLFLIPVIALAGGYSLYFSQTRYRIPIDGLLILLAMQGLCYIIARFGNKDANNHNITG